MIINVKLAEVPTEVLEHLVDHGPSSLIDLTHALRPENISVNTANALIGQALFLLHELWLVKPPDPDGRWQATRDGIDAIRTARQQ